MVSKLNQKEKSVLSSFLEELFAVFKVLDQGVGVLSEPIPIDFQESNGTKISKSLFRYLDQLEAQKAKEAEESDVKPLKKHKPKDEKTPEEAKEGEQGVEDAELEDEDPTKTTISKRIELKEYTSIYQLYHDIKVASTISILALRKGSEAYSNVDNFYKVSVELLLREINRFSLNVKELEEAQEAAITRNSHLEETLAKSFYKISTSVAVPTGETLSVLVGKNLPLFSSLNEKSELDDSEPIIDEPFSIVKIAPQLNSLETPTLSTISPTNFKFPHPSVAPTELLQQYFHPNWYNLPVGQWLSFGQYLDAEFAPKIDESRAVLSNEWRGLSWLEQFGFKKLNGLQDEYSELVSKLNEDNDDKEEEQDKDIEMGEINGVVDEAQPEVVEASNAKSDVAVNGDATNGEAKPTEQPAETENGFSESAEKKLAEQDEVVAEKDKGEDVVVEEVEEDKEDLINLDNILLWNPDHEVDEEELKAVKAKKSQQYINKLLMDLQRMRQKRFKDAPVVNSQAPRKVAKAGTDEIKAFHKARRMLTYLISSKNINPDELNLKISTKLPVLQTTYGGSLAAPMVTNSTGTNKSNESKNSNTNRYKKKK